MDGGARRYVWWWKTLSISTLWFTASFAQADCLSLISGPIAFDVDSCGVVDPARFDTTREPYKFIQDMDKAGRDQFLASYRGILLKGRVSRSQAVRTGLQSEKGILLNQMVSAYIKPGEATCGPLIKKRLAAMVQEVCCDGGAAPPCLLGTSYLLTGVQTTSAEAIVSVKEKNKQSIKRSPDYLAGERAYRQKKYKDAAAAYEKAFAKNELDIKGLFRMGNSYRELENCRAAFKPLLKVYELTKEGKVWAEEELDARRSIFLLARCYSKNNDPQNAVFYLNGFLLEPKKYRAELIQSMKHKDFGWIHTSKEYRDYKTEAEKKLSSTPRATPEP